MDPVSPATEVAQTAPKTRDVSLDAFRGIAIIAVVLAHAAGFGWGYQHQPDGAPYFWYSVFARNAALFALPTFLFFSGYLLAPIEIRSWADYVSFVRKRVLRIAIPYAIWSIAVATLTAVRAEPGSDDRSLGAIVFKLLTGQADGPYYFILLMLQFYLLLPLMAWAARTGGRMLGTIALHAVFIAVGYVVQIFVWPDMPFHVNKTPFFMWLSLFPLGIYVRHHPQWVTRYDVWLAVMAAVTLLALQMIETAFLLDESFELAIADTRFSSLLYAAAVIAVFLRMRALPWPKPLWKLGQYSFGIFFIHGVLLRASARVFAVVPGLFEWFPLFHLAVSAASLLGSCVGIYLTRRAIGAERASRWLGF